MSISVDFLWTFIHLTDIRKIPFGKISKSQLAKGFDALSKLEKALKKSRVDYKELSDLSSRFYTVIPHSPGRSFPLVISTPQMVNVKKDMLMVCDTHIVIRSTPHLLKVVMRDISM